MRGQCKIAKATDCMRDLNVDAELMFWAVVCAVQELPYTFVCRWQSYAIQVGAFSSYFTQHQNVDSCVYDHTRHAATTFMYISLCIVVIVWDTTYGVCTGLYIFWQAKASVIQSVKSCRTLQFPNSTLLHRSRGTSTQREVWERLVYYSVSHRL